MSECWVNVYIDGATGLPMYGSHCRLRCHAVLDARLTWMTTGGQARPSYRLHVRMKEAVR